MMRGMVIDMNDKQLLTLAQLQAFLNGTVAVDFSVAAEDRYGFIARTVHRFAYRCLKRAGKAVVLRFLERVSGYSRQQLTRLVKRGGLMVDPHLHFGFCTCQFRSGTVDGEPLETIDRPFIRYR
jgi:hypothetical protein